MALQSMQDKIALLHERRAELAAGGGEKRVAKQHEQGKLTARERIGELLDDHSFQEMSVYSEHRANRFGMAGKSVPSDGVVVGQGTILGRLVHVASQDFTVLGGTIGELHAQKVANAANMALRTGSPFICINDSGGARVQEGIDALHGCGQIFFQNVLLSGVVPQISILAGPCAGAAADWAIVYGCFSDAPAKAFSSSRYEVSSCVSDRTPLERPANCTRCGKVEVKRTKSPM